MLKRLATVIWWIGAACIAGGFIGIFFNKPSEMYMPLLAGGFFGAIFFSITYVLGGTFLSPPAGPMSKPAVKQ